MEPLVEPSTENPRTGSQNNHTKSHSLQQSQKARSQQKPKSKNQQKPKRMQTWGPWWQREDQKCDPGFRVEVVTLSLLYAPHVSECLPCCCLLPLIPAAVQCDVCNCWCLGPALWWLLLWGLFLLLSLLPLLLLFLLLQPPLLALLSCSWKCCCALNPGGSAIGTNVFLGKCSIKVFRILGRCSPSDLLWNDLPAY